MLKRKIGFLLAICMVMTLLPVSAFAEEIGTLNTTGENDTSMGGLITEIPEGMTVGWNLQASQGAWSMANWTYKNLPVLKVQPSGKPRSNMTISPSQACYIVFDYFFADDAGGSAKFQFGLATSTGTPSASYCADIPSEECESEEAVVSKTWSTGVIDCTKMNGTNKYAAFSYQLNEAYTQDSAKGVYISNIRIYSAEQLPDDYKVHLTVNYNQAHGSLSLATYSDAKNKVEHTLSDGTYTVELPLYSTIYNCKFNANEGVSFDGFEMQLPSGDKEEFTSITGATTKYSFLTPGDYTITAKSSKAAETAEVKVFRLNDNTETEAKPYTTRSHDLYVQEYDADSNQQWRIKFIKGSAEYNSIVLTDNGTDVSDQMTQDDTGSYYDFTPGNEFHYLNITYKQDGCTDTTDGLYFWPTLDFAQAFGTAGSDGKKAIAGMTDDFWSLAEDGKLFKGNQVDAHEKVANVTYNFMFDPDPPAGKDDNHTKLFTSRFRPEHQNSGTSNVFTFSKQGLFSFDYLIYNGNNENDDSAYSFVVSKKESNEKESTNILSKESGMVGWQHVDIPIGSADATVTIRFADTSMVGTWVGISNVSFLSEKKNLTINIDGDGTVTGGTTGEYFLGQKLTLQAVPNEGNVFTGWYSGDTVLSTDAIFQYSFTGEATITAKFVSYGESVAQIGDRFYSSLDEAFEAAKSMEGNTFVRLLGHGYVLQSDFTVPAGETLLVPYSDGDTGYSPVTGFNPDGTSTSKRTGANGTQNFELTIPSNVTLTVEGTVLVNAVTGRPAQGHWDMDVNGGYAQITLDGNIVVKDGGVLDVCGYVRSSASGNGTITAESGGEVRDLYVVRNWRGGSQAFAMFPTVYPMNQVDMHNIEVKTVINAGASFVGTVKMYASGSYYYTHFPQVDQGNGLIQQETDTVTRTYDKASDRETWVLDGTGTISSSILNIVGMDLSTGTFLYPIDGDMDFVVKGNWNVVERLKFMPGAKVDLTEGTLTLAEKTVREPRGNEIVFYPDFQTADPNNTDNTQYPSDRGHAQMTIHGGTTTNVNSAFGGEVVVDKDAAPANPAVIKFMEGKAVSVTSKEANGYYSADLAKTQGTMRELTFKATLGGYTVESGKTYSCYYENDKLVIEVIGETATQEAVYSGQAVTWSGAGEVEYLVGGTWGDTAPTDAGEYPVRKSLDGGTDSYKLVERVGTIDIAPKAAQFALEPASGFTYDGTPKTVTVKVTNAAEGDTVTPVVTGDTTGTDTGEYTVTVTGLEGADKDNYTIDGATTTLTWNIAPKKEDAPTGLGFEYAGNITGLTAGQKYKVNGTEVTADAEGKTAIQDGWFGTTVSVVKSGDGKNTADSDGTALEIPARPAAPEVSTTQTSSSTAEDGSITVKIAEGETYEYRKSGEESWSDVPEGGKLEKLAAGSYEVRVKGTDSTFPGAVKTVTVTYYTPAPSTPSTSTTTTTNPDGSTTKTTTKADGTKTETTTKTDGTVTEKVTQKDGSATEKTTTPEGVTGQVETNAKGEVTSAEVVIPKNEETEKKDVVTAPVEVPAVKDAADAPEISVKTDSADSTKVEIPVTEFGPGTVAVVVHPDGTEEIVRDCVIGENGVVLNVEGDVTLKIVDNTQTFADVEPVDHWAASAVEFVAARQLFNGTDVNEFTPDGDMKRGMLVTVLYRLTYEPEAGDAAFTDVDSNAYYADAVAWAESNGVVNGYGNTFAPEDNVTREQLVTILYRYANKTGGDTGKTGTLEGYADAAQVSDYARDAMAWAVSIGLVNGVDASHLAPSDSATRAEVATILMRFCEKVM